MGEMERCGHSGQAAKGESAWESTLREHSITAWPISFFFTANEQAEHASQLRRSVPVALPTMSIHSMNCGYSLGQLLPGLYVRVSLTGHTALARTFPAIAQPGNCDGRSSRIRMRAGWKLARRDKLELTF